MEGKPLTLRRINEWLTSWGKPEEVFLHKKDYDYLEQTLGRFLQLHHEQNQRWVWIESTKFTCKLVTSEEGGKIVDARCWTNPFNINGKEVN